MFDYLGFGLILGMDWLSLYDAHIYCTNRIVTLKYPECKERNRIVLDAVYSVDTCGMLCLIEFIEEEVAKVPIVRDFADVFESVKGLPLRRAAEFRIDLVPGTSPVSWTPSRMLVPKQIELKCQLEEL